MFRADDDARAAHRFDADQTERLRPPRGDSDDARAVVHVGRPLRRDVAEKADATGRYVAREGFELASLRPVPGDDEARRPRKKAERLDGDVDTFAANELTDESDDLV